MILFPSLMGKQMNKKKNKNIVEQNIYLQSGRKKLQNYKRFFAHLFSRNFKFCYDIKDHLVLSGLDNFFISFNLNFHLMLNF